MTDDAYRRLYVVIYKTMKAQQPAETIDAYERQRAARGRPNFPPADRAHLAELIQALPDPGSLDDDGIRHILRSFDRDDYEWFYMLEAPIGPVIRALQP